jgi:hypothetical protein
MREGKESTDLSSLLELAYKYLPEDTNTREGFCS